MSAGNVRVLAEEFRRQVEPLQDILRHAQNGIDRLDLLISEERETCHSKQSVERIHLQRQGNLTISTQNVKLSSYQKVV